MWKQLKTALAMRNVHAKMKMQQRGLKSLHHKGVMAQPCLVQPDFHVGYHPRTAAPADWKCQ